MDRSILCGFLLLFSASLFAANGGPDQYGYLWKDSDEPDGPVYSWIDITTTGTQVTGLGDDNIVGPFLLFGDDPFYWYSEKLLWIGSNGYLAYDPGNIAADFPFIPQAGGSDNYIAAFMSDLTFAGAGNPGRCYLKDDGGRTIVSYIDVPFWSVTAPGYTGSNTFQIIVDKQDSTITMQYRSVSGFSASNGPVIGIESVTGDIGLMRSPGLFPAANYAVRFYNPPAPLLEVTDCAVDQVGVAGSRATSLELGATLPLEAIVRNTGNQDLSVFSVNSKVLGPTGQTVVTETVSVDPLSPGQSAVLPLTLPFVPTTPGTYRHVITITGIPGEFVSTNNVMARELVVYDATQLTLNVDWAGTGDDLIGIGWNGGNGGVGAYIIPPHYPCLVTGTTARIASNFGNTAFTMKVYDDNGPNGRPGTLLDSVMVSAANGQPGDHVYPTNSPLTLTSGGYYVQWYMMGPDVSIAQDVQAPFSFRSYEVLQGIWAEYRDRDIADFHLGLRIERSPFTDAGCSGIIGISPGQTIDEPTSIVTLVHNYGNVALNSVPVHYRFGSAQIVDQNYSGAAIQPGASAMFTFTQQLVPTFNSVGNLCVWTSLETDEHDENDSTCISIDVVNGIDDLERMRIGIQPNPAQDALSITGLGTGPALVEVFDARGSLVQAERMTTINGVLRLGTQALPDGAYVVRAIMDGSLGSARFVVQH